MNSIHMWNCEVHHCLHQIPPVEPVTPSTHLHVRSILILLSGFRKRSPPLRCSDHSFVRTSHFYYAFYISYLSHLSWFNGANNMKWTFQIIMKLLVWFSPASHCIICSRSIYVSVLTFFVKQSVKEILVVENGTVCHKMADSGLCFETFISFILWWHHYKSCVSWNDKYRMIVSWEKYERTQICSVRGDWRKSQVLGQGSQSLGWYSSLSTSRF